MGLIDSLLHFFFRPAPESLGEVRGQSGRTLLARGRVVARESLASPLTERRCVYYRYLVEEWKRSTVAIPGMGIGGGGLWHVSDRDEAITEFYVDDGTGRALVEPAGAEVDFDATSGPRPVPMPEGRRASELLIEPGDWVEVLGVLDEVEDVFDGERGYRAEATRVTLRAGEGETLRIRLVGKA